MKRLPSIALLALALGLGTVACGAGDGVKLDLNILADTLDPESSDPGGADLGGSGPGGTDPGGTDVPRDPNTPNDPGTGDPEAGDVESMDALPTDPGTVDAVEDPGAQDAAQDPGIDAVEPLNACGPSLNPECEPAFCDDRDPATLNDRCVPDPVLGCGCAGTQITDPCHETLNPKCEGVPCDDGDLTTHSDACVLSDTGCLCAGILPDPCGELLNPQCAPDKCLLRDVLAGQCAFVPRVGCLCTPIPECLTEGDCLLLPWDIKCTGHWDCVSGACAAVCGGSCGNKACEPAAGETFWTCPTDCDKSCANNGGCTRSELCLFLDGTCGRDKGGCVPRPTECPGHQAPVCACDKKEYGNRCEAARAGWSILGAGSCD